LLNTQILSYFQLNSNKNPIKSIAWQRY
jgi:hypothetical protein